MIVVDSSALVAILAAESDAQQFASALETNAPACLSAGTLLELGIVLLHREGPQLVADLYRLLSLSNIEIVPVTDMQARDAIAAYSRYGKTSRHAARLNFGDCFSYALAKSLDAPLLFKGDDIARTDIRPAL